MIKKVATLFIPFVLVASEVVADIDFCSVEGENLIKDPQFSEQKAGGWLVHWISTQHAGEPSYERTIDGGELSVTKVGPQPGYIFKQRLDISGDHGKKLAFYAELAFDLHAAPATLRLMPPGGGLSLTARSAQNGQGKALMDASLLNEPRLGKMDWHPVQVVVELPKETRSIEVGFRLEADGVLKARNPRLQYVDESEKRCEITAGANMFEVKKSALR